MPRPKKIYQISLILLFIIVLAGCSQTNLEETPSTELLSLTINDHQFFVETASTPQEQLTGLMHRTELPQNQGMLFIYPDSKIRSFWMKNTLIPLDIIFIDQNQQIINIHTATPCLSEQCPTYQSHSPAQFILEINAGLSNHLNFTPRTKVNFTL
jgi:uncharacterized membrane protein (UPF0127 family)